MLPALLNVPHSKNDWDIWGFAHKEHHDVIRQAIQKQSGGADDLFQYQLFPIPSEEVSEFLSRNQQSHDDFNLVLGLQGTDLEGVDFKNPRQLAVWIQNHWQEHQNAADALQI